MFWQGIWILADPKAYFLRSGLSPAIKAPTGMMLLHSNMRVVGFGFRSRQQGQRGREPCDFVGSANQLATDALTLKAFVDREIGQVGAVAPVGDRARDPHQDSGFRPRRQKDICIFQHPLDDRPISDRTPLGEGRTLKDIDEIVGGEVGFELVVKWYRRHRCAD